MAEKASGGIGAAGTVSAAHEPSRIRNVVLVGHSDSGKTTLIEALLVAGGVLNRPGRVEDGTTVTDFDDVEVRQRRSVSLALAPLEYEDVVINLLDSPGYADFVGDLRAGLRAADAALFVIAATDGIDGSTRMLWDECARVGMPRAVVVTKIDSPRADFDGVLAQCQSAFGAGVLPLQLPVDDGDGASTSLLDLLSPSAAEQAPDARNALLEGIIAESEDETLMDRYLGGEELDPKVLTEDLEKAVARGSFYPVLIACGTTGLGAPELLGLIRGGFPSPLEHPLPAVTAPDGSPRPALTCDPSGPLAAEVVKTVTDPYVGRLSLVRVFSGTLRPDAAVHVFGHAVGRAAGRDHDADERVGALSSPLGKTQRPISSCGAGDICAVAKLAHAETGDTLSDKDDPLLMEPWEMPEPLLPVAVQARSKSDEDKLSQALSRVAAEDPTLRVEMNAETRQLVLWCMGEAHVDVVLDRLHTKYGVEVEQIDLRVPLRETFGAKASGHGRHVKQSGGHGQFAVCDIEVEPLPEGSGFEFVDKVFGGAVPRQFIPSVEKGVRAQMERGVAAGYPVVDLRVTLLDGKAHSVDSSDMAFQMAGQLALKEAAKAGQMQLLEPVDVVSVLVADDYVGAVMSDLSGRRGRVTGTEPVGTGRSLVTAEVPQIEITRLAVDLRSISHGTGSFTRHHLRYEPMPAHLAAKVIAEGGGT